jgi:hypothetical protein
MQPVRPFVNRIAAVASNWDDDIEAIADLNNEFFYTHFFENWLDTEYDDDSNLMVTCASILNEKNEN